MQFWEFNKYNVERFQFPQRLQLLSSRLLSLEGFRSPLNRCGIRQKEQLSLGRVASIKTDVSDEHIIPIIRMRRISEP
jgi:hypothetical protein